MKNLNLNELQNVDGGCVKPVTPVNPCKPVTPVNPCTTGTGSVNNGGYNGGSSINVGSIVGNSGTVYLNGSVLISGSSVNVVRYK